MTGMTPTDLGLNVEENRKFLERQRADLQRQRLLWGCDVADCVQRTEALVKASRALLSPDNPGGG